MKLKNLCKFSPIFSREDFDYVSGIKNIKEICDILRYCINNPGSLDDDHADKLETYLKNIQSFYFWLNGQVIGDMKEGFDKVSSELSKSIKYLRDKDVDFLEKRANISRGYARKFMKTFIHGMRKIGKSLADVFSYRNVSDVNVTKEQIRAFMLDGDVGLGRRNIFKESNYRYNIRKHVLDLDKRELSKLLKAIEEKEFRELVKPWTVWGNSLVRVHLVEHNFRKPELYRVYKRDGEHDQHERDLRERAA